LINSAVKFPETYATFVKILPDALAGDPDYLARR
jgi:hypothetical protein